jgi:alkylhydroperoxidase family enzyme
MTDMSCASFTSVTQTRRIIDQIGLLVSLDNSCRYCFGYPRRMMRALGVSETEIRQVEDDLALDDTERRLLDFARAVSRANPLPGPSQRLALVEEGVAPMSVREAAACSAFMICCNRAATIPALPPQWVELLPDRWFDP